MTPGWWRVTPVLLGATLLDLRLFGAPQGMTTVSGAASVSHGPSGATTTITVSDRAVLNWQSFNIGRGESATFVQPSVTSIVWNRITDGNPTQIFGQLTANGRVVLANEQGFYFGPDAMVRAAGFVATTARAVPTDFASGGMWAVDLAPPTARIVNYGTITVGKGGAAFLLGMDIENHGTIQAPGGTVGLYGGEEVVVSERPDGRGLSARVQLPAGTIRNAGRLMADAGMVALHSQVVNQDGLIQANSVRENHGVIEIVAADAITLEAHSTLEAKGDSGVSTGGEILVKAGRQYSDAPGSTIDVSGGNLGGNGGHVEVSAPQMTGLSSHFIVKGSAGAQAGELTIDPDNIVLTRGGTPASSGTVGVGSSPSQLTLDIDSLKAFSKISLQATRDITLNAVWELDNATAPGASLTLQAGRDLRLAASSGISVGTGWSISLTAGTDFQTGKSRPDIGSVILAGTATVAAKDGPIEISAGKDVTVATGAIRSTGGGSISIQAGGNVNAGTRSEGLVFSTAEPGYQPGQNVGGISTAAGGDVTIRAGRDVISFLPTLTSTTQSDGGSGAFGEAPGNVTVTAGGSVFGHYVLRNGTGSISAQGSVGDANRQLALSLVKGSWSVDGFDINLQEVRNPNGTFNRVGRGNTPTRYRFDYDPAAAVTLNGRNSVSLLGLALPRNPNDAIPILYPGTLRIQAGAGGVQIGNPLTLFPSETGQLEITTTDGGNLQSTLPGRAYSILMSDSVARRFDFSAGTFGLNDHAPIPLHLKDPEPVRVNISGDVRDILLISPKHTELTVGGNLVNASLVAQNLHASDVTRMIIRGEIINRNEYTFIEIPLNEPVPDLTQLENALPAIVGISLSIFEQKSKVTDPLTGKVSEVVTRRELGLRGRLTETQKQQLLNFQVKTFDSAGQPIVDELGEFITTTASLTSETVIAQLFQQSQDVPDRTEGYQITGPGRFEVQAKAIDLGVTRGILSRGAEGNPALVSCTERGADIQVTVTDDLSLYSSAIVSKAGGRVDIQAGGRVVVGSNRVLPVSDSARGIYTSAKSDVTVIARGDIDINGSRIAAYDGGNRTIRSLEGSVNAGSGGLGFVRVEQVQVNPLDCSVITVTRAIPGSGILATTFPESQSSLGNILVETPRGDIIASSGGVVQVSLNNNPNPGGKVQLSAGTRDAAGNTIYRGTIDASNSGVIGSDIEMRATADIKGVVFARGDLNITTPQNVNVTALAGGSANVSAGGSVGGTVIGIGSANVSGGSGIDAAVLSQNATVSGSRSGTVGFAQAAVASATSQSSQSESTSRKDAQAAAADTVKEEDPNARKNKPVLTRTVGRVTVLLPPTRAK